jgi:hypothetical protein
MPDPHVNMSPAADLVMAVVMIVLLVAWLGLVFFAARQPYWARSRRGEDYSANAHRPEAVTLAGEVPAGPPVPAPAGRPVQPAPDGAPDEPLPGAAGQTG